nr:PEPxxWA-CTERM sorting domain-containing protein [Sphingomonas sp. Leaf412]
MLRLGSAMVTKGGAVALALLLSSPAAADTPRGAGAILWEAQPADHGIAVEHVPGADDTASLEQEIAALGEGDNVGTAEQGPLDKVLRAAGHLPEPATWALMILGFGGIAGAMRHRLRKSDAEFTERVRRIADGED